MSTRLFLIVIGWSAGMLTAGLARAQVKGRVEGVWSGSAIVFGTTTPVIIHLDPLRRTGGARRATLDLPTMGMHSVQVDSLLQGPGDDSLRLVVSTLPGKYVGRLSADARQIRGFLLLAGQRLPLQLQPGSASWTPPCACRRRGCRCPTGKPLYALPAAAP
ncbi:hypothetical protein [Hymenobacter cellulosilyticus]|uniref:Uncharacterized protein n=1 Tax=Hymenobacter cellulosilyticus TaxID=2932248 RepID=A0A8T9QDX2_9BACT|nr:hypothetical protein [Hymenobacter cellulosilyticus]UOQ74020.1 hypothetical protein MUN79_09060 [Hymenobacter cellulosilyticus]